MLQNSRRKYYSDSKEPAPWKWFKDSANNPYKVPLLYGSLACLLSTDYPSLYTYLAVYRHDKTFDLQNNI